jgi:hypothetical protein
MVGKESSVLSLFSFQDFFPNLMLVLVLVLLHTVQDGEGTASHVS